MGRINNMILKKVKHTYIPVIIALVIFYLCCLIQPSDVPEVDFDFFVPTDKLVHFCMYFGLSLGASANYIYNKKGEFKTYKLVIGAFFIPIIYGGFIEIAQHYHFPSREGDWFDFLADVLGSLSAIPLAIYFKNFMLKKQRQ